DWNRCTVWRATAQISAVPSSQTPQRCHFSSRTTVSSGSLLRAIKVPSRSEHSREQTVQRSRSISLCRPVHERWTMLPAPERLNRIHCGFGQEHRVELSCAGVVGIIAVLLWQGWTTRYRCDASDATVLFSRTHKLADALDVPGAIERTGPGRPPVGAIREVPDRDGPSEGVATGGCGSLGQTAPQNVALAVPIEVSDALD